MNVFGAFDGISCGQLALQRAGIKYDNYFASEIDKYAIAVTQYRYPNTVQLGNICSVLSNKLPRIDLFVGGSPCTSLSIAKRQKESGLQKGESVLFFEYLRLLNECNPKYFLLENVASMKLSDKNRISELIGVEPIKINSNLVSAQMRNRLYWTNIPNITQPTDKRIYLKDILESGYTERDKSYCITSTYSRACIQDYIGYGQRQMVFDKPIKVGLSGNKDSQANRVYSINGKSVSLVSNDGGKTGLYEILNGYARKLTPVECERLQTIPDNYTLVKHPVYKNRMMSNTQRYKMLGNAWTVDVIAHIFSFLPKEVNIGTS